MTETTTKKTLEDLLASWKAFQPEVKNEYDTGLVDGLRSAMRDLGNWMDENPVPQPQSVPEDIATIVPEQLWATEPRDGEVTILVGHDGKWEFPAKTRQAVMYVLLMAGKEVHEGGGIPIEDVEALRLAALELIRQADIAIYHRSQVAPALRTIQSASNMIGGGRGTGEENGK